MDLVALLENIVLCKDVAAVQCDAFWKNLSSSKDLSPAFGPVLPVQLQCSVCFVVSIPGGQQTNFCSCNFSFSQMTFGKNNT